MLRASVIAFVAAIAGLGLMAGCAAAARGPDIGHLPELTSDDPSAEGELRDANDLAVHGDRAHAEAAYSAFLKKHPSDALVPVAQLALGKLLLEDKKPATALPLFQAVAAHREPAVAEQGRFYVGVTDERLGQHDAAIAALGPMVGRTIEPADTTLLLVSLAGAYEQAARIADAIQALQTLSEANVPEADRTQAQARIEELAEKRATPAEIRQLYDTLDHGTYAWRFVAVRALRDADATRDNEHARELLAAIKEEGVPFDEELAAVAMRAEHPSDANPAAIGAILSLSGRARRVGELSLRGLMLAAGLPPQGPQSPDAPQLIFRDDAGDPAQAVEAVNELVATHRVIAIIGPMDAQVAQAAGKRAQELGVPLIALTPGGSPETQGSMVFRYFTTPAAEAQALVAQARARGAKRFAILRPQNAYGEAMQSSFEAAINAAGGSVVDTESYPTGTTSFGGQAATLEKHDFDALFVADAAQTLALIAPALAAAGLWSTPAGEHAPTNGRAIVLGAPSVAFDANLPKLAGRYLQGALISVPFDAQSSGPAAAAFNDQFKQQFGGSPEVFAAFAHDAYRLVRSAIDAGAVTRAALAERLPQATSNQLVGPSNGFNAAREPKTATRILELQGDNFVPATH